MSIFQLDFPVTCVSVILSVATYILHGLLLLPSVVILADVDIN